MLLLLQLLKALFHDVCGHESLSKSSLMIDGCYFWQEEQEVAVEEDVEIPAAAAESAPEVPCPDCSQLFQSRASLKVLLFGCEVLIFFSATSKVAACCCFSR